MAQSVALARRRILRYNLSVDDLFDPVERARQRLQEDRRPTRRIAAEAGLKESWIRMFREGRIADPGYTKITRVLDYYNGRTE